MINGKKIGGNSAPPPLHHYKGTALLTSQKWLGGGISWWAGMYTWLAIVKKIGHEHIALAQKKDQKDYWNCSIRGIF